MRETYDPQGRTQAMVCCDNAEINFDLVKRGHKLNELFGQYGPRVAIVGAGPSLDETMPLLRNEPYIIATDRVLDILIDNEIPPAACITIDPSYKTTDFLRRPLYSDVKLLSSLKANSGFTAKFDPACCYWYTPFEVPMDKVPEIKALGLPHLPEFGHCAGAAYFQAILMGFTDIQLYGCDYSFWAHEFYDKTQKEFFIVVTRWYCKQINTVCVKRKGTAEMIKYRNFDGSWSEYSTYPWQVKDVGGYNLSTCLYTDGNLTHCKKQLSYIPAYAKELLHVKSVTVG